MATGKCVSATHFSLCFKYSHAPSSSYGHGVFVTLNFHEVASFVHTLAAQADAGDGIAADSWAPLRLSERDFKLGRVNFAWLSSPLPHSAGVRGQ